MFTIIVCFDLHVHEDDIHPGWLKVIHPKYTINYSAQPFGHMKNGLVSGRLACDNLKS